MKLERLISRQWWKTTVLVIAAVAVMIRLGIWQLDRLEQRREFNARVAAQLAEPALDFFGINLQSDLYNMEYRAAIASGEYDFQNQIVLRNQDWQGRLGVHLLTPLRIEGSQAAVLVDRGWIPYEDYTAGNLSRYDVLGTSQVEGIIRRSQSKPAIGGRADQVPGPGEEPLKAWNWININQISQQVPYELLPVYLAAVPGTGEQSLPYRSALELDLSEGSHLGYAFQWFAFAAILAIGYPAYVRREDKRAEVSSENTPYIDSSTPSDPDSKGYKQV
jgi:surfeit locus 1 family protein